MCLKHAEHLSYAKHTNLVSFPTKSSVIQKTKLPAVYHSHDPQLRGETPMPISPLPPASPWRHPAQPPTDEGLLLLRDDRLLSVLDDCLGDVHVERRRVHQVAEARLVREHGRRRAVRLPVGRLRQVDLLELEQVARLPADRNGRRLHRGCGNIWTLTVAAKASTPQTPLCHNGVNSIVQIVSFN